MTILTHATAPLVLRPLRFLLPSQLSPLYTPVAPLLSPRRPLALLHCSLAVPTAWLALVLLWLVLPVSLLFSYRHKRQREQEGGLFVQFSWICPEISIRIHFDKGSFLWNTWMYSRLEMVVMKRSNLFMNNIGRYSPLFFSALCFPAFLLPWSYFKRSEFTFFFKPRF